MERLTEKTNTMGNTLSPKWIDMKSVFLNGIGTYFTGKAVDKLAEYEDLEEQGRLIRLPCAVGDTVYSLDRFCGGYSLDCPSRPCESCEDYQLEVYEGEFKLNDINDFGKTVFLTQPEAAAKLAEMEGKK